MSPRDPTTPIQTVERVAVCRASRRKLARAEVFSIGPRKAVMEYLEARSAIQRGVSASTLRAAADVSRA